jgi:hypothetical protein
MARKSSLYRNLVDDHRRSTDFLDGYVKLKNASVFEVPCSAQYLANGLHQVARRVFQKISNTAKVQAENWNIEVVCETRTSEEGSISTKRNDEISA